ncbi:MAG TPA: ATP-binding protein [Xanthobacteraceae bacterium]|nr:ATP-binding protein [Xanthobacteraceae bacterium]
MRHPRSIRFHLSLVFIFFFLLIFFLGMLSIARLRDFNNVSADIADLWLPNTRVLGDLNNYTSDFRAAEGSILLSSDAADSAALEREMIELDHAISQAQGSYEHIRHDGDEQLLYTAFRERWNDYRAGVNEMLEISRNGRKAEAISAYRTTSRAAYNAASDVLGQLTKHVVENAQEAAGRVAVAYQDARWLIGIAMVFAGVLVVGALVYISRSISTPLLRLASYMHRLAANDTDIEIRGTERQDEIGEMARAAVVFRNNAIELMVTQRGLARQASMLEEKLAAERHLTQLQRNFVSMASHEFRTPLTIIDGHAQRLNKLRARIGVDEIVARAGKIRAAVLRMTHLIDNLLTSTRLIESGAGLYFHPQEVDLRELVHDVCQLHRECSPGSTIAEELGDRNLRMVGDPKLLSQVFDNLLSNAIKYSPGGGIVRITSRAEDGWLVVAVEDRGIGIPSADVGRLFERYFRGSNVSGIVGTGVGLNLVKMVVDLHGGDITVESQEGQGSRFTVRLPIKPPPQANRPPPSIEMIAELRAAEERVDAVHG